MFNILNTVLLNLHASNFLPCMFMFLLKSGSQNSRDCYFDECTSINAD